MAAPTITFCADITAAKCLEIAWEFDEFLYDLEFVHAAKQTEIVDFIAKVILEIILEIFFEFVALGILVINGSAGDIAFVGGSLVADDDVF